MFESDRFIILYHEERKRVECPFEELGCKFLHSFANGTCDKVANKSKDNVDEEGEDKFVATTSENTPLCTSTPKITMKQCEECVDGLECINCLIRNTNLDKIKTDN